MPHPFLNSAQVTCLSFYGQGDFAHLIETPSFEEFQREMEQCGDTLLQFMVVELAGSEDCDSVATAIQRMENAIQDIEAVKWNLDKLPAESWSTDARDTTVEQPALAA